MTHPEERTHPSTINPLQEQPWRAHPIFYFLQHPLAVLKTKGKRCTFIQVHVSEALVLQMGDFVHQRS